MNELTVYIVANTHGGFHMPELNTRKNPISAEEVLRTEVIVNQALIDILIAKQIISEDELVNSIKSIRQEQEKMLNESNKIVSLKR
jgi:hypothetical protein